MPVEKTTSSTTMVRRASPKETIPPVKTWSFEKTDREGGRTWAISHGGKPLELTVENTMSPFDLSSLKESVRMSLSLRLPREWGIAFECMESCLLHEVSEKSMQFCGAPQTVADLTIDYKPITKQNGDYPRHLKVKLNTTGAYAARYWDDGKARVSAPASHAGQVFDVKVVIRSVWFLDDAWGLVCDATDFLLQEQMEVDCPF